MFSVTYILVRPYGWIIKCVSSSCTDILWCFARTEIHYVPARQLSFSSVDRLLTLLLKHWQYTKASDQDTWKQLIKQTTLRPYLMFWALKHMYVMGINGLLATFVFKSVLRLICCNSVLENRHTNINWHTTSCLCGSIFARFMKLFVFAVVVHGF